MRRVLTVIAAAVVGAACASLAFAATVTVTLKDRKGDGNNVSGDLRSASARYDGKTLTHTIREAKAFKTQQAPCLVITQPKQQHDILICGDGTVLGFGPGPGGGPHVKATRPSSRSIAYSFKPAKLGLKGSYLWGVNRQTPAGQDKLPDKGCAVEKITTSRSVPNPPKTRSCRKFR
jgi:hypothetical protein